METFVTKTLLHQKQQTKEDCIKNTDNIYTGW